MCDTIERETREEMIQTIDLSRLGVGGCSRADHNITHLIFISVKNCQCFYIKRIFKISPVLHFTRLFLLKSVITVALKWTRLYADDENIRLKWLCCLFA